MGKTKTCHRTKGSCCSSAFPQMRAASRGMCRWHRTRTIRYTLYCNTRHHCRYRFDKPGHSSTWRLRVRPRQLRHRERFHCLAARHPGVQHRSFQHRKPTHRGRRRIRASQHRYHPRCLSLQRWGRHRVDRHHFWGWLELDSTHRGRRVEKHRGESYRSGLLRDSHH
jgi:hypothetical protein